MLQYKKGKERQGEPMTEDKGVQSIDRALDIIEAVAEGLSDRKSKCEWYTENDGLYGLHSEMERSGYVYCQ